MSDLAEAVYRISYDQFAALERPPASERVFADMRPEEHALLVLTDPDAEGTRTYLPMVLIDPTRETFDICVHWMDAEQRDAISRCLERAHTFTVAAQLQLGDEAPPHWEAERDALDAAIQTQQRLSPEVFFDLLGHIAHLRHITISLASNEDLGDEAHGFDELIATIATASQHLVTLAGVLG